ncbi:DnaJ domain-containing protein [Thamnocephalis sphaerospora]|uniref:DnaJ domain-containing protein n=1 Tax=Thamnocephalis sphaerospora TaxID=78915 RepID=A0A4P9XXP5_9FUNG|nr:DnaJ domain-containing protein [Thamnocephalis sphaerospora]|eukprot:RKP11107.1 DnaJ domain-containing protein [Thamnocephalis sphaerospora]
MARHTRLYAILELEPEATTREVGQSFRKLSLRWHPDKHPPDQREQATERFREIAEAYEVLSDEEKRSVYDRYGEAGLKGEVPVEDEAGYHFEHFQFHSPFDVFRNFFAHDPAFAQMFNHTHGGFAQQRASTMPAGSPFARSPFAGSPFGGGLFAGGPFAGGPFAGGLFGGSLFGNDPFFAQSPFGLHGQTQSFGFHPGFDAGVPHERLESGQGTSPGQVMTSVSHQSSSRSAGEPRVVSRQQSVSVVNGQRTVITRTVDANGTETTTVERADGSRETTVNASGNALASTSYRGFGSGFRF